MRVSVYLRKCRVGNRITREKVRIDLVVENVVEFVLDGLDVCREKKILVRMLYLQSKVVQLLGI